MWRFLGIIVIGWGILDVGLSYIDIDFYTELGIDIPEPIWKYTGYMAWAAGAALFWIGSKLDNKETEGSAHAQGPWDVGSDNDGESFDALKEQIGEDNNPEDQTELGHRYLLGDGVSEDPEEAVKWYKKAAEQGYPLGQYFLATTLLNGTGIEKDELEAVKWLRKAAESGLSDAQCELGECLEAGTGVADDHEEALKWYKLASEQDSPRGHRLLAVCHGEWDNKNFQLMQKAAEAEDSQAQDWLGDMYRDGREGGYPVEIDIIESAKWYMKAIDQENWIAMGSLADLLEENGDQLKSVSPNPYAQALKLRERLATEINNSHHQYSLGLKYLTGDKVKEDKNKAEHWFCIAAEQDDRASMRELGKMYQEGNGVKKDLKIAIEWYTRATRYEDDIWEADGEALTRLGLIYQEGNGVKKNAVKAAELYYQALKIEGYFDEE